MLALDSPFCAPGLVEGQCLTLRPECTPGARPPLRPVSPLLCVGWGRTEASWERFGPAAPPGPRWPPGLTQHGGPGTAPASPAVSSPQSRRPAPHRRALHHLGASLALGPGPVGLQHDSHPAEDGVGPAVIRIRHPGPGAGHPGPGPDSEQPDVDLPLTRPSFPKVLPKPSPGGCGLGCQAVVSPTSTSSSEEMLTHTHACTPTTPPVHQGDAPPTRMRSNAEGVPPLCTWPSTVTRVSKPSLWTTSCSWGQRGGS